MDEKTTITEGIRARTMQYITAAFGLVAGLAWNDAIKSMIALIFPTKASGVTAQFVYAIILTVLLVFVTISLNRALKRLEHLRRKEEETTEQTPSLN